MASAVPPNKYVAVRTRIANKKVAREMCIRTAEDFILGNASEGVLVFDNAVLQTSGTKKARPRRQLRRLIQLHHPFTRHQRTIIVLSNHTGGSPRIRAHQVR